MDNFNGMNQYNMNQYNEPAAKVKNPIISRCFNASAILGTISAILIFVSLYLPAIDLSHFDEKIEQKYTLIKLCERINDFISEIWAGIPVGIIIGAVLMIVLSYIKIPLLKLIPSFIVMAMVIIMLVDMGNIIEFVKYMLETTHVETSTVVDTKEVFQSFQAGIYVLAAGLITGFISCFMPTPE